MTTIGPIDDFQQIAPPPENKANDSLGQADFLTLMITQFQNQDPFEPMDNGEFLGQLAQFSTVNGISSLNTAFSGLASSMQDNQALQAAGLVGRSVLAVTDVGSLADDGSLRGGLELESSAGNVQVMAHPLKELPTSPRLHSESDGKLHVGYFGFLSPAKDLTSLIQACQKVPDVVLHLLASVPQTQGDISGYARTFIEVAERYDWIDLDIEFLPLADVVLRLSQNDVNVYLTSKLSHGFSSSGSVRQYLAAKRPILANPSPLISDLQDVITVLPDNRPDTIAAAIRSFDPDTSRIEAYVPQHTWDAVPDVYGITV